jgi:predicted DNA-binding protein with PD1-like motif
MKFKKSGNNYLLRIDKGEKFPEKLMEFAIANNIKTAEVKGIGAVKNPVLSCYLPEKKSYVEKELEGDFEILSLAGNITMLKGKAFPHFHVALSDEEFKGFGGHLQNCEITGTMELFIYPAETIITRRHDDATNLQIWNLE